MAAWTPRAVGAHPTACARWHVTSERGVGLVGTFRDDLGTIPYGAQCHLLIRNLATGQERRDDDCVADDDGTFSTGASPRQHVRVRVVIEDDQSDAEHPIAADTISAPIELRVRPWVELRDVYTGGRLLDGRLVIRFNAVVDDSPGIRKGRLLLQRKAGAGFVDRRRQAHRREPLRHVRGHRAEARAVPRAVEDGHAES